MNVTSTVTSKGQITLSSNIRKQAKIKPGDKLYTYTRKEGNDIVIVHRKLKSLDELMGSIKKPVNVGKIEELSWI